MANRSTAALPKVELELCEIPEQTVLKSKAEIDERFAIRTKCFSNGLARGAKDDILSMLKAYHHEDAKILSTEIPGIFEVDMRHFFPYHDGEIYLLDMINRFPTLKIAGFLETDWVVYIALSDSGYAGITDMEIAGVWDTKSENSWQWNHSPTEDITEVFSTIQASDTMMVSYIFPYEEDWHDRNYYVVKGGNSYRLKFENRTMALPWDSPNLWTLAHSEQYADTAYIVRYLGNEPDVILPEKIGDINIVGVADREEDTPKNYKKIRSVQIPKTYESIGKNAFRGCIALKEVLFCDGKYPNDRLRRIDDHAFADCSALEKIQLPKLRAQDLYYADNLESLGDGVFENCSNLRDVWVINPGINASADNTFKNCENYIIHGMPEWNLAQANPRHYKAITAEECLMLFGAKQWPLKSTCGTTAPYKFILNLGEWVTYKNNVRADYLVGDSGNTIKCEWWGELKAFSGLFDIKFSGFSFGYSEHCCELELYPKGMRPADGVSSRKPVEYTSVKNQQFADKIFVLDNQVRLEVEDRILERGGVIKPTVVLKTDYLVINSCVTEDTAKRKRAVELLQKEKAILKIITVEEFFDMILKKSI